MIGVVRSWSVGSVSAVAVAACVAGSVLVVSPARHGVTAVRVEMAAVQLQAAVATEMSAALNTADLAQESVAADAGPVAAPVADADAVLYTLSGAETSASNPFGDFVNGVLTGLRSLIGIVLSPVLIPLFVVVFPLEFGCLDSGFRIGGCQIVQTVMGFLSFFLPSSAASGPAAATAGRGLAAEIAAPAADVAGGDPASAGSVAPEKPAAVGDSRPVAVSVGSARTAQRSSAGSRGSAAFRTPAPAAAAVAESTAEPATDVAAAAAEPARDSHGRGHASRTRS